MKRATKATFSAKQSSSSNYSIRSISLPTRSHPSTVRIEQELTKLTSWEASSSSPPSRVETICFALSGLAELYKCLEDLLKLPSTQQALSQHQNEKWVDELLDCPLKFLDILSNTRDAILLMKSSAAELQSALRRRKVGDLGIENYFSEYYSIRRKMRKECTKSLLLLKQIMNGGSFGAYPPLDQNDHVCAVVRVLTEASLVTSSIFEFLLVFLSSPLLKFSKLNKWAFVSRLVQKGGFVCNNQKENINDLEKVDFALNTLVMENLNICIETEKIQEAKKKLEDLVDGIEGLENGIECLFRHLINNRAAFLNIISP